MECPSGARSSDSEIGTSEKSVAEPLHGERFREVVSRMPLESLRFAWASDIDRDKFDVWAVLSLEPVASTRLRLIPPGTFPMGTFPMGTFPMGSPDGESGRFDREGPQHRVKISQPFWLFETPCTQAFWRAVTGRSPSRFSGDTHPVERVSWNACRDFHLSLSSRFDKLEIDNVHARSMCQLEMTPVV